MQIIQSDYLSNEIIIENTHRIAVIGVKTRSSKLLFENKFPMVFKKKIKYSLSIINQ